MKITFKKSVTSLMFFIFNILYRYKKITSLPLDKILTILYCFDKSETTVRTGLSRMLKSNYLQNYKENGSIVYSLTDSGLKYIINSSTRINRFLNRYQKRFQKWDGSWHMLMLDDFNKSDYENHDILNDFYEFGLQEMNCALISPYSIDTELLHKLDERGFSYTIFSGQIEKSNEEGAFVETVFNIYEFKKRYEEFLQQINNLYEEYESKTGEEILIILFDIGWAFYNIILTDPVLPKSLIGEWEEDKVVQKMSLINDVLNKKVLDYFKTLGL